MVRFSSCGGIARALFDPKLTRRLSSHFSNERIAALSFQPEVISCFSNDIRRDPLLRSGIGNQKSIVTEYINETGKPSAIVCNFLDGIRCKELMTFVTYCAKPVVYK